MRDSRTTNRRITVSLLILVVASLGGAIPAGVAMGGDAVTVDGALHIQNSARPSQGRDTVRLEELWRVGGEDDDDVIFGQIVRVRSDDAGQVYLLDAQLKQVFIFAPDGVLVRTVCREGEGPGEVRRPRDMTLLPDGAIGVIEGFPGGVVSLDQEGVVRGEWSFSQARGVQFTTACARAGRLVVGLVEHGQDEATGVNTRTSLIAGYSSSGEQQVRYHQSSWEFDYHDNFVFDEARALVDFVWSYDVGPDGRVYIPTERNTYAISVFHPDGTLDRVIEREFESRRRTATERARIESLVERRFRTFPFELTLEVAETEPDVSWLHRGIQVADDGTLWVRHSRSGETPDGETLLTFDRFDPAGHYIQQMGIACDGDALRDGFFLTGTDRLIQVRGFVDAMRSAYGGGQGGFTGEEEPAPLEVICYAIQS